MWALWAKAGLQQGSISLLDVSREKKMEDSF